MLLFSSSACSLPNRQRVPRPCLQPSVIHETASGLPRRLLELCWLALSVLGVSAAITALLRGPYSQELFQRRVCVGSGLAPECRRSATRQVEKAFNLQMKSLKLAPGCPRLWWALLGMGSLFSWAPLRSKQPLSCAVARMRRGHRPGLWDACLSSASAWCCLKSPLSRERRNLFLPLSAQCQFQQL